MKYDELKIINNDKKSPEQKMLLIKAKSENKAKEEFYRSQYKNDKKPYWLGKIGYCMKQNKLIHIKLQKYDNESNGE